MQTFISSDSTFDVPGVSVNPPMDVFDNPSRSYDPYYSNNTEEDVADITFETSVVVKGGRHTSRGKTVPIHTHEVSEQLAKLSELQARRERKMGYIANQVDPWSKKSRPTDDNYRYKARTWHLIRTKNHEKVTGEMEGDMMKATTVQPKAKKSRFWRRDDNKHNKKLNVFDAMQEDLSSFPPKPASSSATPSRDHLGYRSSSVEIVVV